jgi:hypothetical protein
MKQLHYAGIVLLAVLFTWLIHEFAHWAMGTSLGNDMVLTLNTAYPKGMRYAAAWQATIISAAGPLVTIVQAFICYMLLKRGTSAWAYPFLLTCVYMRVVAGAVNIVNLNDEGRISNALGLGTFTIPVLVAGLLVYLTYTTIKARKIPAKTTAITLLWIIVFSTILILVDQKFKIKLIS